MPYIKLKRKDWTLWLFITWVSHGTFCLYVSAVAYGVVLQSYFDIIFMT